MLIKWTETVNWFWEIISSRIIKRTSRGIILIETNFLVTRIGNWTKQLYGWNLVINITKREFITCLRDTFIFIYRYIKSANAANEWIT
jgi:hypothetical protein